MAYNHGREDRKWRIWKEAEEKAPVQMIISREYVGTQTVPYHVRLLLDEFSNIGQIPKFDKLIATIRSREISASIILQSQSQLKTIYKDAAETITGIAIPYYFLEEKKVPR